MHFITALHWDGVRITSSSTFGYFNDHDEAHGCVARNTCNMDERLYNYLVIEDVPEGLYPMPKSECWFEWTEEQMLWQSCSAPDFSKRIINWCF